MDLVVTDDYEPSGTGRGGGCKRNLGLLQEQEVLFSTEHVSSPSLSLSLSLSPSLSLSLPFPMTLLVLVPLVRS